MFKLQFCKTYNILKLKKFIIKITIKYNGKKIEKSLKLLFWAFLFRLFPSIGINSYVPLQINRNNQF
jgi:hypothetical protein